MARPKTDPNAPPVDKAAQFKERASVKTNKAILAIRSIGELNSKRSNEWTPDQIKIIGEALVSEVNKMALKFSDNAPVETGFTL